MNTVVLAYGALAYGAVVIGCGFVSGVKAMKASMEQTRKRNGGAPTYEFTATDGVQSGRAAHDAFWSTARLVAYMPLCIPMAGAVLAWDAVQPAAYIKE